MDLNKAQLIGRLGADPELRYTQSNVAVATCSVATSRKYTDSKGNVIEETEWHRVIVWGKLAEVAHQYLHKGDQVYFEGMIITRSWEDKNGEKRYTTEIKASSMILLGGKKSDSEPSKPKPASDIAKTAAAVEAFEVDDALPF